MRKIEAYTGYSERTNTHFKTKFKVIDALPKIKDDYEADCEVVEINKVSLDIEEGNDEVYDYDYFEIIYRTKDCDPDEIEKNTYTDYVAIEDEQKKYEDLWDKAFYEEFKKDLGYNEFLESLWEQGIEKTFLNDNQVTLLDLSGRKEVFSAQTVHKMIEDSITVHSKTYKSNYDLWVAGYCFLFTLEGAQAFTLSENVSADMEDLEYALEKEGLQLPESVKKKVLREMEFVYEPICYEIEEDEPEKSPSL